MSELYFDTDVDVNNIQDGEYSTLPAGEYLVVVKKAEQKTNEDETRRYIQVKFEVTQGAHKGTLFNLLFNTGFKNATEGQKKNVEIATRQLNTIRAATGFLGKGDASQMYDKPFVIGIKIREHEGKTYNEFKYAKKYEGQTVSDPVEPAPKKAEESDPWA